MDGDHEYIARVTCIETGASEEYSIDMPVYLTISRGDTGYESSDDSTMTTSTTASTKGVSVSSAPPQNANIIGIWPVYVTLSFLIGVATGCFGYYLLKNKCKKKEQQTRYE